MFARFNKAPLDESVIADVKSKVEITMINKLCVVTWLIVNSSSVKLMAENKLSHTNISLIHPT